MTSVRPTLCFSYWTDPLCIWAFVAEPKLVALLAESTYPLRVNHRVVPVFGDVPSRFATGVWRDEGPAGRAAKTAEIAERAGRGDVSGRVWIDDPPASSWPAGAAIKAVFAAEAAGEVASGAAAAYQYALRELLFVENLNVARRSVQLAAAEACDLPRACVEGRLDDGSALALLWRDFEAKEALRVRGSPTYVFDDAREMLYGNVPLALIRATVDSLIEDGAPGRSPC